MLNPCARESKDSNREVAEEKAALRPSYEGQQGAANGQNSWGFFRNAQGFGRLDAGSRAGVTSLTSTTTDLAISMFPYF